MKKIIVTFLVMLLMPACYAVDVVVESLIDIDTSTNTQDFRAKILDDAKMESSGITFTKDSVINGKIVKLQEASRGDRDAYIVIQPISEEKDGISNAFNDEYLEAKVVGYSKRDWKETTIKAGTTAGLTVGSHFVPGLSQMFYFTKGLITPAENQSRLESAVVSVWENSPFKYLSKGEELNINEGDMLVLKMYHTNVSKLHFIKRQK